MRVAEGARTDEAGPRVVARPGLGSTDLLASLGIAVVPDPPETCFLLVEADGRLELRPPGESRSPGIAAHFPPDRPTSGGPPHPLVRAFGKTRMNVFDLTAGLGADAYRLAEAGHRVRACEREPALFALLETGWAEARERGRVAPSVAERLDFVHAEAESVVAAIEGEGIGVYLDPMYPPPRRASALPRREVQVLRRLLGEAEAPESLLAAARARAARVVVKRPHHAPPLASGASFVVESKLVRFDVYLDPRHMGTTTI
jgi:16S rRNA (guanine1516-N2)-methyltransferase